MCAAMARQSARVVLFCRRGRGTSAGEALAFYGIREPVELRGIRLPRVPVVSRALYSAAVLARLAFAPRPDVVYGRDPFVLGLLAATGVGRAPLVFEVHKPPAGRVEALLHRLILASPRLQRLVVISDALGEEYRRRFGERVGARTLVARDGADPAPGGATVDTPAAGMSAGSGLRIGYVGSLSPGKGLELILRLAPLLPECRFEVIGGAPEEVEHWRARAPANLALLGFMPPEEARARLAGFDALLAPYQDHVPVGRGGVDVARWMSPLKVFEYMAAGRAIVASDLPVLREFLRDGENALLAPASDEHAWAQRVRALQADPAGRASLGARARAEFLASYTWDQRARLVLGLGG